MKKLLLIFLPSGVRIELGKNGPFSPCPSAVMAAGGIVGFWMRYARCQRTSRTK
jgi:hypothetical protein